MPAPPILAFFWLMLAALGWLMVLLTARFWKWSGPASGGLFFLIYLAPFLTANAARLLRGCRATRFHRIAYRASLGYSALMAVVVLWIAALSFLQPWRTYREVSYGSNSAQVMDILVPRTAKASPTIILLHGGGFIAGDKLDLEEVARQLVQQGFTVANVNYRLATQEKNQYPTAVDDVQTAVTFLKGHGTKYKVDGHRMVALGTSAGANLAIELGLAGQVQAVIDFYGPTNFMDPRFLDDFYNGEQNDEITLTYLGASLRDDAALYYDASPLDMVSAHMPRQ